MKGAINASVALVIGVVILVLAASGITTTFNLADAFDPLGYKERQAKEADATIALQKSLDCAYYRCLSGCEDPRAIKECGYVNGEPNQAMLDRFCDKRFQDKDGRICGSNSLALPVSALSPVKEARAVFSNGKSTFKFDNKDKKSIDSCVAYLNRDDCDFTGTAPLGDIENVLIEIPPKLFTKKDAGVCHGIGGAEVRITASQLYIWSTDIGTGFLHTSLRTCEHPAYKCTGTPLQCSVRSDKDKCEDNDSGCKWEIGITEESTATESFVGWSADISVQASADPIVRQTGSYSIKIVGGNLLGKSITHQFSRPLSLTDGLSYQIKSNSISANEYRVFITDNSGKEAHVKKIQVVDSSWKQNKYVKSDFQLLSESFDWNNIKTVTFEIVSVRPAFTVLWIDSLGDSVGCIPDKVGQGEGPRPCQLFTDERKCSSNNCQWNPRIS